jgi:hypothetical protein
VNIFSKDLGVGTPMLCGLEFLYSGGSKAILGEDSQESQTIHLSSPIQTMSIHYTQCYGSQYLVIGLMITTGEGDFEAGNCSGEHPDILRIDKVCTLLSTIT